MISVVIQGSIAAETTAVISAFREAIPNCEVIVSTWANNAAIRKLADKYIVSADPGPLPVVLDGKVIRTDNVNRQLVSTLAGLRIATLPHAMKWRSDFLVTVPGIRALVQKYMATHESCIARGVPPRVFVCSCNTANPFAHPGLVFHISDWFYLGPTRVILDLLRADVVPGTSETTTIGSTDELSRKGFAFAAYTAEQWMIKDRALRLYGTALRTYDDKAARNAFIRFLSERVAVVDAAKVGLVRNKYEYLFVPSWSRWKAYFGTRVALVSQRDSWFLRHGYVLRLFGTFRLRAKGTISRLLMSFVRRGLR